MHAFCICVQIQHYAKIKIYYEMETGKIKPNKTNKPRNNVHIQHP